MPPAALPVLTDAERAQVRDELWHYWRECFRPGADFKQARFGELVRIADITSVTARQVVPHGRMAAILAGLPRHLGDALTVAWVYRLGDARAAQRLGVSTSTVRRRCQASGGAEARQRSSWLARQ